MRNRRRLGLASSAVVTAAFVFAHGAWAAPTMTVTPAVLAPSQTLNVSGAGFAPSEGLDVFVDTTDVALLVSDASGNVAAAPVTVPATVSPGNHWVTLLGRRDGVAAQKLITVHTGWVERGWSAFARSLNPFENMLSPANVSGLQEDWTASSGPVQGGGAVVPTGSRTAIFGDTNGVVRSVSLLTGATVWTRPLGGMIQSTPAIDSGRVYVVAGPSGSGTVTALNSTTGAIIWQTPNLGLGCLTSPAVVGNVVYVGSLDGNLYALNGSTGAIIWKGPTGGAIYGSPAVSGGRVFIGSDDNKVYAFAVGCGAGGASCTPLWTRGSGGSIVRSSPAVSNGVVYLPYGCCLFALNATNGKFLWAGDLGGASPDIAAPAVANGIVFVDTISGSNTLIAFRASCGLGGGSPPPPCPALWHSPTYSNMQVMPAVADGVVYVGANDVGGGQVLAFPASSSCSDPCSPSWAGTQAGSVTSPIVVDGMVLVGFDTGAGAGGLVAWDLPAATHAPPVARPDPRTLKPDLSLEWSRP